MGSQFRGGGGTMPPSLRPATSAVGGVRQRGVERVGIRTRVFIASARASSLAAADSKLTRCAPTSACACFVRAADIFSSAASSVTRALSSDARARLWSDSADDLRTCALVMWSCSNSTCSQKLVQSTAAANERGEHAPSSSPPRHWKGCSAWHPEPGAHLAFGLGLGLG
jgi:hypothetical protein